MANFGRDLNASTAVRSQLMSTQWIDERTRAVFLESLSLNPNTGLYTTAEMAFEFFAGGSIILKNYFTSLQLNCYIGTNGTLLIVLQFIILAVIALCFISMSATLWKQKLKFFKVSHLLVLPRTLYENLLFRITHLLYI